MAAPIHKNLYELTDAQLVGRLLTNEEVVIQFVFYEKYASLFRVNASKAVAKKGLCYEDLVQDFYLYLSKNDWEKLRKYNSEYPFASHIV